RARLIGTRSSRDGLGARLTVTTADLVQRTASMAGSGGYMGQSATELLFGLGESERADINIKWPGGISQDFWDSLANRNFTATEGVLEGSCPMVFAWDGTGFEYVSDILGSSVTGFYMAPGVFRFPIDTDEYLILPDAVPRDGVYSVRVVELLNEIGYMDHARLLVIDHPADVEMYPNETLMLVPPFPEPVMHVVKDARPPVSAVDEKGNDILDLISAKDGVYAETFEYLPYEGFAEEHSTILDLGDLSGAEKVLLILDGWTHYVTCYSVYEAIENGVPPMLPRLDVLDEDGEWVPATMNMGMPAGQPKTTTFDMTGMFLTDEYKIRITTNLQIFYDQILVSTYTEDESPRVTELEATTATLSRKGYPVNQVATGSRGRSAAEYDYEVVDEAKEWWTVSPGNYTAYGDVAPLVTEVDDMFVVMRHGDEIALDFDGASLPPLPAGWERSIVLYMDGFFRYLDSKCALHEDGFKVEPMPFHGMSTYPYPQGESYPDDEAHRRYLEEYNTRREP
ncbi:MAG: ASPIC/UnbV domain-containing protein, partial [Chloroflexi bacterium]|nr:ASPIC/UnbV domain-containing protein [Chloroflexota bacterium]